MIPFKQIRTDDTDLMKVQENVRAALLSLNNMILTNVANSTPATSNITVLSLAIPNYPDISRTPDYNLIIAHGLGYKPSFMIHVGNDNNVNNGPQFIPMAIYDYDETTVTLRPPVNSPFGDLNYKIKILVGK